jgi:hypothetical protein
MTALEDARVESLLRESAAAAVWPPTPDLRSAVVARIARDGLTPLPAGGAGLARPTLTPRFRVARALAVALLALLVLAGVAAALGYRLPGFELVFVERLPSAPPAGIGLDLGSPIPLADARALDRPHVLVPATLPEPDAAYELGAGDRRIVTLAYRATGDQPTLAGSDLALTVMAVPGDTDGGLVKKLVAEGSTIEAVQVAGSDGWWITGAPHEVLLLRPDGEVGVRASAHAGDTLVFARDGTLYRLESALGRDATIAIAESMR